MFCNMWKKIKRWGCELWGNANLRILKPATGRWQDLVSLFLLREWRAVWLSRICLLGRRVFAVNCIVEIGVEQTPHPGQGQDINSSVLNCQAPGHTFVDAPHPSMPTACRMRCYLSAWHFFIHSPIYPLSHPSIHPSVHSSIHPPTHLSIHSFICLSIHSFIYPSIHLSTHLFPSLTQHLLCGWPFSGQRDTAVTEMDPGPPSWKVQSGRELTQCGECLSTSGILRSQKELYHLRSRAAPWWRLQLGSLGVSHWAEGRKGKFQMKGARKDPQTRTSTQ